MHMQNKNGCTFLAVSTGLVTKQLVPKAFRHKLDKSNNLLLNLLHFLYYDLQLLIESVKMYCTKISNQKTSPYFYVLKKHFS